MRCNICGSQETYVKNHKHDYQVKGKSITFVSERRFCSKCNNFVYDSKLDTIATETALITYSQIYGISKEDIICIRKNYDLSIELFAKVIGCAKKTLISYEQGKSIPNDSYKIILKSLISNPQTITNILDANKEQFTEKEYQKVKTKVNKYLSNNTNQFILNKGFEASEYNGYVPLSKEKVKNIILYFAFGGIYKTKLLKEMFYNDFVYFKNTVVSMSGLEYVKLPYGPVPDQFEEILNELLEEKAIEYKVIYNDNYENHIITSKQKFDKSVFDKHELENLKKIKDKFKDFNVKDIVEFSHKEKAFIETKPLEKINYEYALDIESI